MKLPWDATIHFTPFSPSGRFYRSLVNFMNSAVTKAIWPARMLSLAMRVKVDLAGFADCAATLMRVCSLLSS